MRQQPVHAVLPFGLEHPLAALEYRLYYLWIPQLLADPFLQSRFAGEDRPLDVDHAQDSSGGTGVSSAIRARFSKSSPAESHGADLVAVHPGPEIQN